LALTAALDVCKQQHCMPKEIAADSATTRTWARKVTLLNRAVEPWTA
jgi:hypothetical protein